MFVWIRGKCSTVTPQVRLNSALLHDASPEVPGHSRVRYSDLTRERERLLTRQVRQLGGSYVAHRPTERLKPMVVGSFLYPDKKNNKNCLFKEPTDLWVLATRRSHPKTTAPPG